MTVVLASTSSLSALTSVLNFLLGCTSLFVIAFWVCLAVWTWRDIRARTSDQRIQLGATLLVASLFVGEWFVYRFVRPRQTRAEIYERQLEEASLLAEMAERQICQTCQTHVAPDFQICPSCGNKLKHPCPRCERLLERRWSFCPYCATQLGGTPVASPLPGMQGMSMPTMAGNRF